MAKVKKVEEPEVKKISVTEAPAAEQPRLSPSGTDDPVVDHFLDMVNGFKQQIATLEEKLINAALRERHYQAALKQKDAIIQALEEKIDGLREGKG